MYKSETTVRVRYAETDMMGYVYYGNYATYFEVARVEAIRSLGFSYQQMEKDGYALPVSAFSIRYYKPAFYDDCLTIETSIAEVPGVKIKFLYKTFNESGVLLNEAETTLVFISKSTMKPCAAPEDFVRALTEKMS